MNHPILYYWDDSGVRWSEVSPNKSASYSHCFGGQAKHKGVIPPGGLRPFQLLFNFNLRDPHILIEIPEASSLPLYYPFQYDANICYRMVSDDKIELVDHEFAPLRPDEQQFSPMKGYVWNDDFPFADYPLFFPKCGVELSSPQPLGLDTELWDEFEDCVVNIQGRLVERYEDDLDEDDDLAEWAIDEMINAHQGFLPQDIPSNDCPSCDCKMQCFFVLHCWRAINEVDLWGQAGRSHIYIHYEICPNCKIIFGSNQC